MKTIVLCGGGTAGHIMPLVALLPYLKKKFDTIADFSSGKEIEKRLMNDPQVKIFVISPPAFRRSLSLENLLIPAKLSKSVKECKSYLTHLKADVVFSKGGYCALPVCLAAKSLKIPYFCHESDLSLGLANKITYKKAEKLLTVFEDTAVKYGGVCVGAPIRDDFGSLSRLQAKNKLGIHDKKPVLLVTGGSQGSRTINAAVRNNLGELVKRFNVVHLCGKGNKSGNKSINGYFEYEFADMNVCLTACDLVLSRGGSNTLFEIMYCKKPAVIVPLKKGSRGDQKKNADYFSNKGALIECDEHYLDEKIITLLDDLWRNKDMVINNMNKLNIQNGTKATAKIICDFIQSSI